jgi:hypothetical protein
LNRIIEQIPIDRFKRETPKAKRKKIFSYGTFSYLLLLIGTLFSLPVSDSFIETLFSFVRIRWTDSRNFLLSATIKALLQIKVNFDHSCSEMHSYLLGNKDLLREIQGNEKHLL